MRVTQYRDLLAEVRDMSVHYHACTDLAERTEWQGRARDQLRKGMESRCARATEQDRCRMGTALVELQRLIASVEAEKPGQLNTGAVAKGKSTRASQYNKSASRAVRLNRAARSAMRRGYF